MPFRLDGQLLFVDGELAAKRVRLALGRLERQSRRVTAAIYCGRRSNEADESMGKVAISYAPPLSNRDLI